MHLISPEELASAIADRLARQSAVLVALDGQLRQRQNDAGRTAGMSVSSKHHRPHRRLLSPAIPTSHRLGEDSLRQHGHPAAWWNEVVAPAPGRAGILSPTGPAPAREDAYLPPRSLSSAPLVIVEGSCSHHPSLAPYYDISEYSSPAPDEQARGSANGGSCIQFCGSGGSRWKRGILQNSPLRRTRR